MMVTKTIGCRLTFIQDSVAILGNNSLSAMEEFDEVLWGKMNEWGNSF